MKKNILYLPVWVVCAFICLSAQAQIPPATLWLTRADRSALFERQSQRLKFGTVKNNESTISVDDVQKYQVIDGFGFALTGGSAQHIIKMSAASRAGLLQNLFTVSDQNIGISYLRLSVGASDLNERVFTYDDIPQGQTDLEITHFDLADDKKDVIPVMKEILKVNPKIKIMASPWSPPAWMKTTYDMRGGRLKPEFYGAYAKYLVKYIQAMKAEGIVIDALTIQNEPLHPGNNPSLLLVAPDEAEFIKNHLGPAFKAAMISTKIIIYDHNADRPDYPISILNDPAAKQYIDGSGFHLYGGEIEALSDVHNAHPDKNIYFTEQMVVEKENTPDINIVDPVSRLIIGAPRNWARVVLEWNLAADPQYKPYTDRGGCPMCQGAITIAGDKIKRNIAYYAIAHASKFVRPGSVRVASNEVEELTNVAFKTPDGKRVLIVANTGTQTKTFNIKYKGKAAVATLEAGSVGTYVW